MVLRLLLGLLKGLVIGGAIGAGICALGFAVPPAWMAYPVAAVVGMLVALVAGKPIWKKGARIEVGMKAVAGALLAPALLFATRRWLAFDLPIDLPEMVGWTTSEPATFGMFALTSLAMVAALVGAFFDADHDPSSEEKAPEKGKAAAKQRIAADGSESADLAGMDLDADVEAERKLRK